MLGITEFKKTSTCFGCCCILTIQPDFYLYYKAIQNPIHLPKLLCKKCFVQFSLSSKNKNDIIILDEYDPEFPSFEKNVMKTIKIQQEKIKK